MVVLLNLLIAIMADTFSTYKQKGTETYLETIANVQEVFGNFDT